MRRFDRWWMFCIFMLLNVADKVTTYFGVLRLGTRWEFNPLFVYGFYVIGFIPTLVLAFLLVSVGGYVVFLKDFGEQAEEKKGLLFARHFLVWLMLGVVFLNLLA